MIKSFRHAGLQRFFETGSKAGINPEHAPRLNRILGVLNSATVIAQIDIPGYKPHKLNGDLAAFWAIKVSSNWRIIFKFEHSEIELIDYLDYH
ncbi:MAG: Killer protein [Sulfuriferula sp.]|nr:Killer protein [Sulfuriferula sp.]